MRQANSGFLLAASLTLPFQLLTTAASLQQLAVFDKYSQQSSVENASLVRLSPIRTVPHQAEMQASLGYVSGSSAGRRMPSWISSTLEVINTVLYAWPYLEPGGHTTDSQS